MHTNGVCLPHSVSTVQYICRTTKGEAPTCLLWSGPLLLAQGTMRWWIMSLLRWHFYKTLLPLTVHVRRNTKPAPNLVSSTTSHTHTCIVSDIWTYTHQTRTFNPNPHHALVSKNWPILCSEILTSQPSFPSDTGSDPYQTDI